MIKKILLTILWTVVLTFCACMAAFLLCAGYLKVTLHGARPDDHTREIVLSIWTYTSQIAQPIAFLLGALGWLPGTRLQATSPPPSIWARWCYRVGFAAFVIDSVISILSDATVWGILAIAFLVFLLGTALIDKYVGRAKSPANDTPYITGQ